LTSELYHSTRGIGEDIREGKRSLVAVHSIESHTKEKAKRLEFILNSHTNDNDLILEAIDLMNQTKSIEFSTEKAK